MVGGFSEKLELILGELGYIKREEADDIKSKIKDSLSDFEYSIIHRYILGKSYEEIAVELNVSVKSVDNAIQRIRRKLK